MVADTPTPEEVRDITSVDLTESWKKIDEGH